MSVDAPLAPPDEPGPNWAGGAAIAALAAAAYGRTFTVPFVFDDLMSIPGNPTLRRLTTAFFPPHDTTVAYRPVLNLSFALNYAVSGAAVWSYHALNVLIHVTAALTLWGLVRRLLGLSGSVWAGPVALSAALLWALHPLQTEAVTYTVQRAESLMGLFYLLTLYCFIRGWPLLAILSCLLGMGTKEVMVSAPLAVLLVDRTFLAGSFREAWRQRWRVYLGLAGTWVLLALLVAWGGGSRGGSTGFGTISWPEYELTQFPALCHYLELSFWPHPLVFEYAPFTVAHPLAVLPQAIIVLGLAAVTVVALWRWPAVGLLGFVFFAVLAPTSLIPGSVEMISEHRMYLALAPLILLVTFAAYRCLGRFATPLCWGTAAVLLVLTFHRNRVYRSMEALWQDTVQKAPKCEAAHLSLGMTLAPLPGRLQDAIREFNLALRLTPNDPYAHYALANAWARIPGHLADAMTEYEEAERLNPNDAEIHNNFGNAWLRVPGRLNFAIEEYRAAVGLDPNYVEARNNLGVALASTPGRLPDAIAQFKEVLRLEPDDYQACYNLAVAYCQVPGHQAEAKNLLQSALKLQPDNQQIRAVLNRLEHGP